MDNKIEDNLFSENEILSVLCPEIKAGKTFVITNKDMT